MKLGQFLKENTEQLKALIPNAAPVQSAPSHHTSFTAKFSDVVKKYEVRKKKELAEKTVYQYVRSMTKFQEWAESRDGYNPLLMSHIDKRFMSQYIDYMHANGYENNTIEDNHMKPLNTFFKFATSIGEFPDIPAPSKGHGLVIDKQTKIKKKDEEREMFSNEDLQKIFNVENYAKIEHPCGFWLPLLDLYTGARMNELCTLATIDVKNHGDFYSINITPEIGTLKTDASKRRIPLHNKLIEIGFLDYLDDVKKHGVMLFPNLQPDTFGSYIKEPSRRFGKYLDDIGIPERTKVFHSFRSTVTTLLVNRKVNGERADDNWRKYFLGHEIEDTQFNHYIKDLDPSVLQDKILKYLDYDKLEIDIKYRKGMFDKFLAKRMKELKNRAQKSK